MHRPDAMRRARPSQQQGVLLQRLPTQQPPSRAARRRRSRRYRPGRASALVPRRRPRSRRWRRPTRTRPATLAAGPGAAPRPGVATRPASARGERRQRGRSRPATVDERLPADRRRRAIRELRPDPLDVGRRSGPLTSDDQAAGGHIVEQVAQRRHVGGRCSPGPWQTVTCAWQRRRRHLPAAHGRAG